MVTVGIASDMNWGKSYKTGKRGLNNSDNVDGIVK